MARLAPILLAVVALLAPASAHAVVNIEDAAYNPATVTISPGSSVTWHYANDTLLHPHGVQIGDQTICDKTGGSGGLTPDCTSPPFNSPARITYHDVGCDPASDSTCISGQIVVYVPPTASFTASPNPTLRGQTVNFDASASAAPGGTITGYTWDFGDGSSGTGALNFHTYAAAGTYTVRLTVTDDQNKVAVQSQAIQVKVPDTDSDGVDDDHDQCLQIAAFTPTGCPPPPIAVATTAAKKVGSTGAIKSGLSVVVECSGACTAQLEVLDATAARRALALPGPLASGSVSIPAGGGSQLVTLKFTAPAKAVLAKLKNPKLKLRVTVTDEFGRVQTRESSITLSQVKTLGKLPAIGISDQQQGTFSDPLFQVLKLKYARLVTPWNSIFSEPERLDAWLQAAHAAGVRPLVSFEHKRSDHCPAKPCKAPSVGQYRRAWAKFHKRYSWVKDISPWNEANSSTQPTGKRPDLAAAYYNVVRASCRGCRIVAADVLDLNNMRRFLAAFQAKAKGKPRLWGLHNYRDTNRFRQTGTKQLLAAVKGEIWFTETGGIVKFTTQSGKKALPTSESRAKKAMDYMFRLAELNAKRIKRIYVYQWKINFTGDRFDAGVVRPDGTPRPSFDVLTLNASIARKR
jgi:PKD repeat protein